MRISGLRPHYTGMVYLITWRCYGSPVPGEDGVVSRHNNLVGARRPAGSKSLARASRSLMTDDAWEPDAAARQVILQTLAEVCRYRNWTLLAAHVRSSHVHVVVQGETKPEQIMHDFKSYSSRALNRDRVAGKRWARHGSTVYLWTQDEVANAIRYVTEGQGEPMGLALPDADPPAEPRQSWRG